MRRFCLRIFLLVWAGCASAQTLDVTSGEHEDFTRLVVRLPESINWTVTRSDRSARLNVSVENARFDLDDLFTRIPRTRLSAARQSPGVLDLSLGCECDVESYRVNGGYLVLDIRGTPAPGDSPPLRTWAQFGREEQVSGAIQDRIRLMQRSAGGDTLRYGSNDAPARTPVYFDLSVTEQRVAGPMDLPIVPAMEQWVHSDPRVADDPLEQPLIDRAVEAGYGGALVLSEDRLIDQMEHAADQGLLQRAPRNGYVAPDMASAGSNTAPLPIGITSMSVIDRDFQELTENLERSREGGRCVKSSMLALHEWGGDATFEDQISTLRGELVGEFDNVLLEPVQALARAYLHYGFGAEARHALALVEFEEAETDLLETMSRIIDGDAVSGANPFTGQARCETDAALWAYLAAADPDLQDLNVEAVLIGFARLPAHLRRHLGPRLSRQFSARGDIYAAETVLRASDRAGLDEGAPADLARAAIADLKGDDDAEETYLESAVTEAEEESPEALVALIDTRFDARAPIDTHYPDLIAGYAQQYRRVERGRDLRRAHIRSLALTNRYDDAFSELSLIREQDGNAAATSLAQDLLTILTETGRDVDFMKHALGQARENAFDWPEETGFLVAERLMGLGFATEAAAVLDDTAPPHPSDQRRLLRAEAALAQGEPSRALADLLNVTGPEADRLRSEALLISGEMELAGTLLVAQEDPQARDRGLWLTEDPDAAELASDSYYAGLMRAANGMADLASTPDEAKPLATARSLLEEGEALRSAVSGLLEMVEIETPATN
ncbi:hypothetical protein [Chachezhania antarctica]|uniref:hypothetical protein n=1 Tax=Chachezhania antarctica TaxID=2340860 RepID=UPI000EB53C66|nr:hypothetical protein [Chachezhania antarctica]|tara:strand:+ start:1660 stop:4014 length:2355 start_codon:yes stop_codon:yes gene_type:complete